LKVSGKPSGSDALSVVSLKGVPIGIV
jgi:hypothetical protein